MDEQNTHTNSAGDTKEKMMEAMSGLEAWLAPIFEKAPHLPPGGRNFLITIAPWFALIFGILGLTAIFGLLGLLGMSTAVGNIGGYMGEMGYGAGNSLIMLVFSIVSAVILLMAYTGLKAG